MPPEPAEIRHALQPLLDRVADLEAEVERLREALELALEIRRIQGVPWIDELVDQLTSALHPEPTEENDG